MFSALPEFIPGLELSRRYYQEIIRPLIMVHFPSLPHSAALVGFGSDVIGMDTPLSRDHMWGPRLILFLSEINFESNRSLLDEMLRGQLPYSFLGYPTSYGPPDQIGVRLLKSIQDGPVDHLIDITTLSSYFDNELGSGAWQNPSPSEWLTFSEHRLLTLTSGAVFHDDLGLNAIRTRLTYYPRDIWLYLMASDWSQIGQEEPFVGRTGEVGDDFGSRLLAARLVQTCMRLCFRLEKQYTPYSKWFGSAFQRLNIAAQLSDHLNTILTANDWQTRETGLCQVYINLAAAHNQLGITSPLDAGCSSFHGRPYQVIHAERFAEALQQSIQNSILRNLPLYGSPNQFSSSTDLLDDVSALRKLKDLFE
ncbi:MAG: hypothetical protein CVU39_25910 [Chloroflexi bacterium HGW-Chloroflexi-10]|nr:MAG: hypothetical protein CVU39_25910 [Chloroflexi bacterium HGW-Chloroflexi-10]